jgi:hypothetical protein
MLPKPIAFLVFIVCFALPSVAVAQATQRAEPWTVYAENNEDSKANLDLLAHSARNDKLIILIARLGQRETSRPLNSRRLQTASKFLEYVRAIERQRIVRAQGEPIRAAGRIEAYIDGKLFMIFIFRRNRDFASEG